LPDNFSQLAFRGHLCKIRSELVNIETHADRLCCLQSSLNLAPLKPTNITDAAARTNFRSRRRKEFCFEICIRSSFAANGSTVYLMRAAAAKQSEFERAAKSDCRFLFSLSRRQRHRAAAANYLRFRMRSATAAAAAVSLGILWTFRVVLRSFYAVPPLSQLASPRSAPARLSTHFWPVAPSPSSQPDSSSSQPRPTKPSCSIRVTDRHTFDSRVFWYRPRHLLAERSTSIDYGTRARKVLYRTERPSDRLNGKKKGLLFGEREREREGESSLVGFTHPQFYRPSRPLPKKPMNCARS
jgi:hypothetical protein